MPETQTFILSQVAEIAQVPRNTLRDWLRRDHFELKRTSGWQRFRIDEVALIGVYADIMKKTKGDHELALAAAQSAYGAFRAWMREGGEYFAIMHAARGDDGNLHTWISSSPAEAMDLMQEIATHGAQSNVLLWIDLAATFLKVVGRANELSKQNGENDE